jgi:hypothetical protein
MCDYSGDVMHCGDAHVFYMSNTVKEGLMLFKDEDDVRAFCNYLDTAMIFECCSSLAIYLTLDSYHLILRQDLYSAVKAARNTSTLYTKSYNLRYGRSGSLYTKPMKIEQITSGWQAGKIYQDHFRQDTPGVVFIQAMYMHDIYKHIEALRKKHYWDNPEEKPQMGLASWAHMMREVREANKDSGLLEPLSKGYQKRRDEERNKTT